MSAKLILPLNDKKQIRAWCMYDWANSVYSLSITTAIFPIYYNAITGKGDGIVRLLGYDFKNTALYSLTLSFSFLIVVFLSPLLSGIADSRGDKKMFMRFFCYLGSFACMMLALFTSEENVWIGIVGLMLANVGYAGSLVFYNAFLPEIATPDKQDKVSARGFTLGYIGSVILLIVNLGLIMAFPDDSWPPRISFLMVGLWWLGFGTYTFSNLHENKSTKITTANVLSKGYREIAKVFAELKSQRALSIFLLAFFIYNMAVQTVMLVASLFGKAEIKGVDGKPMDDSLLIVTILVIQLVAVAGAYLFSYMSKRLGNLQALLINLIVWILICVLAYFTYYSLQFVMLGMVVGLVMGGVQALSRSTYSKMLPHPNDNASYFSFYDVCLNLGTVCGTFLFGWLDQLTGSMRISIIALSFMFVIGIFVLVILLYHISSHSQKFKDILALK